MMSNLNRILLVENIWHKKICSSNFNNRWRSKCRNMQIKIPVMRTTCFPCYKKAGCTNFLHFMSEKIAKVVSLKDFILLVKLSYKSNDLYTCNSVEVPDSDGFEKRRYSNFCAGSVKID